MASCFISYARADDEPFAARLRDDLTRNGVSVWWDRQAMRSRGRTFLAEISSAIDAAERMLLVIGPDAGRSPYVRTELEQAARTCTIVIPLLRLGSQDDMPAGIPNVHWLDFRDNASYAERLDELLVNLREEAPRLASLHGVLHSPEQVVAREADLEALEARVLADLNAPVPATSVTRTTVVTGMSGVGKSVLAGMLARSCTIRRHMSRVCWLEVGVDRRPRPILRNLGRLLGDDPRGYRTLATAREAATAALQREQALLVLDDAWRVDQLRDLLAAAEGSRTRLVVTTREATLASALGAHEQGLEVLSDEQAVELLAARAGVGHAMAEEDRAAMAAVAARCGNLPLALAVCGALAREGLTWADIATALDDVRLEALDLPLAEYPGYEGVFEALTASIAVLEAQHPEEAALYRQLAVFRGAEPVPVDTVLRLWGASGVTLEKGRRVLTRLVRKSLLRAHDAGERRSVSLHALQHTVLTAMAGDPADLHRRLLAAYRPSGNGGWASVPDDGYLYSHLAAHLLAGDGFGALEGLLREERPDGTNAWYAAREATDVDGYLADVQLGWDAARRRAAEAGNDAQTVTAQVLCALIVASLRSLADSLPGPLLVAAVRSREWVLPRAVQVAMRMSEPLDRARALAGLAACADAAEAERLAREVLKLVPDVRGSEAAELLSSLGDALGTPSSELVREALDAAARVTQRPAPYLALEALAPHLDESSWGAALALAAGVFDAMAAARCYGVLAGAAPTPARAREIWALADGWLALVSVLPVEARAFTAVEAARPDGALAEPISLAVSELVEQPISGMRTEVLFKAAGAVSGALRQTCLDAIAADEPELGASPLAAARRIARLAPRLAPDEAAQLLPQARSLYGYAAVKALAAIAARLSGSERASVIGEIVDRLHRELGGSSGGWIADVAPEVGELVPELPRELVDGLLDASERDPGAEPLGAAVLELTQKLPAAVREPRLARVLAAAGRLSQQHLAVAALAALAPGLPAARVPDAIRMATGTRDSAYGIQGLKRVVDALPEPERSRAVGWALEQARGWVGTYNEPSIAELIKEGLAGGEEAAVRADAERLARSIGRDDARAGALAAVAATAPADERARLVEEAEQITSSLEEPRIRAMTLAKLAAAADPSESARLVELASAALESIPRSEVFDRKYALLALAPLLDDADREEALLSSLLDDAGDLGKLDPILAEVAPRMSAGSIERYTSGVFFVGQAARDLHTDGLVALTRRLVETGLVERAFALRAWVDSSFLHASLAPVIAPVLPCEEVANEDAAMRMAEGVAERPRDSARAALLARMAACGDQAGARGLVATITVPHERVRALAGIAESLAPEVAAEVLGEAAAVLADEADDVYVSDLWNCLAKLAPRLAELPDEQAAEHFDGLLSALSRRTRLQAMPGIYELTPLIARLGGAEAVAGALDAVIVASRWWPSLPPAAAA